METTISFFLFAFAIYIGIGLLFAFLFAFRGASKIDVGASNTPLSFKLLLIPAATAFWPILLIKWIKSTKQ